MQSYVDKLCLVKTQLYQSDSQVQNTGVGNGMFFSKNSSVLLDDVQLGFPFSWFYYFFTLKYFENGMFFPKIIQKGSLMLLKIPLGVPFTGFYFFSTIKYFENFPEGVLYEAPRTLSTVHL